MRKGAGDHVDISQECDTLPLVAAGRPRPGSATSWRNAPQSRVSLALLALGGVLLVCLGLLLGIAWSTQTLDRRLRRLSEERRRLNEEWSAVRLARQQPGERIWYLAPTGVEGRPDDD